MAVNEVRNVEAMRWLGLILIIVSVVEFGVGGAIFAFFTNVHLGAWWAAVCTFIAGILGLYSYSHNVVVAGCFFSVFGALIAMVGAIVDGISAKVFDQETGCINTSTGDAWGSDGGKSDALLCALGYLQTGSGNTLVFNADDDGRTFLTNRDDDWTYSYNCVCTDDTDCYQYNLRSGDNCGLILTTYTSLLAVSTALCVLLCLTSMLYSIFTCVSCLCGHHPPRHPPVHLMHPEGYYYSKSHQSSSMYG